jgi:hypothetical protein
MGLDLFLAIYFHLLEMLMYTVSDWEIHTHTSSKITYLHIVTFCQGSYNGVHGGQRQTTYYLAPRDLRLKPLHFCDPSLRWIAEEAASFQPWKQTDAALRATTQCHLEQRSILSIITDQPCHWSVDSPRPDKPVNGKTSFLSQADYSCCTALFMQRSQWDWWCRLLGPFWYTFDQTEMLQACTWKVWYHDDMAIAVMTYRYGQCSNE